MNKNIKLFKDLDNIIYDAKGNINEADFFRLIGEYQLSRIDKIESVNNNQQKIALCRTAMYDTELVKLYNKSSPKKKEELVFKLVNLFCISNTSLECLKSASDYDKDIFNSLLTHKEKILNNKEWYLRVIPESKWFLLYLENSF